jgi:hypothetical protein
VWQGRYCSCPLDEPHLWEARRYTELNPTRASLVARGNTGPDRTFYCYMNHTTISPLEFGRPPFSGVKATTARTRLRSLELNGPLLGLIRNTFYLAPSFCPTCPQVFALDGERTQMRPTGASTGLPDAARPPPRRDGLRLLPSWIGREADHPLDTWQRTRSWMKRRVSASPSQASRWPRHSGDSSRRHTRKTTVGNPRTRTLFHDQRPLPFPTPFWMKTRLHSPPSQEVGS